MKVLSGMVYEDRPVSGMTTLNERFIDMLRPRVDLGLLIGATAASSAQRARASRVGTLMANEPTPWPPVPSFPP